MAGFRNVW